MKSDANLDTRVAWGKRVLLDLVRHLLGSDSAASSTMDRIYTVCLDALTRALLADIENDHSRTDGIGQILEERIRSRLIEEPGPLAPEQVGEIYESLRGLRLEIKSGNEPVLIPHAGGRRNQGLFYTPRPIVEQIVAGALDALEISEPEGYLDLKILDPAVGTGVFLAQALEEVTRRVLASSSNSHGAISPRLEKISDKIRATRSVNGIDTEPTLENAIRIHVVTSCLYGVELDPIAAHIARAVLRKHAFDNLPAPDSFSSNIRTGNSLMGSIRTNPRACGGADWRSSKTENLFAAEFREKSGVHTKTVLDRMHARAYFGKKALDDDAVRQWSQDKGIFHWPLEFPQVFQEDRCGFDVIIGNPPYEIISVKESGIRERTKEQAYFRRVYRSCHGKINTYRLMMERSLSLLSESGVLGFIVPATLLADSTAEKLRRIILDETRVCQATIIPEKSQIFKGVTQAFVILITRKPGPTESFRPVIWDTNGPPPHDRGMEISRRIIEAAGLRVPLIRSSNERDLLEALTRFPPLGGNRNRPALGRVHQGEINLTVHREFITSTPTEHPLIRGEHVAPLCLTHPSPSGQRLDWVLPEFLERGIERSRAQKMHAQTSGPRGQGKLRGRPWETSRIVIGRVVNMDTRRRLKAATAPAGAFLGDMTNFIAGATVPTDYLLGLLNSRLLNWRFKITSTNNYLSAAEIEALPIPRIPEAPVNEQMVRAVRVEFEKLQSEAGFSVFEYAHTLKQLVKCATEKETRRLLASMVQWLTPAMRAEPLLVSARTGTGLWDLLDALVVLLYQVDAYVSVIEDGFSVES